MHGREVNIFNIKGATSKFTNYQYYDDNSVFVLHTKYVDEDSFTLSPTVIETHTSDNLSYDIDIPEVDGYTADISSLTGTLDEAGLEYLESLDYVKIVVKDNIYNIYITIKYSPIYTSYTIEYYEQNTGLSGYDKVSEEVVGYVNGTYTSEVIVGKVVTIEPKSIDGFTLNTSKTEMSGKAEANGTKVFKAYYDRNSYYLYMYNTGDTEYLPIEFKYGQNKGEIKEPTKIGYVFDGWKYYKSLEGEEIEEPATIPAHDLYAEAQWISADTSYTLSYYTENANNDSYTNIGTYEIVAKSGENLKETDLSSIIQEGFSEVRGDTYKYYHYNEEKTNEENNNFDIEVDGTGVTIIPIYYDRNVYNIEMNFNDSSYTTKAEVEINGQTYTDSYTFQAKFNQNITDLWLTAEHFNQFPKSSTTTMYLASWTPSWQSSMAYSTARITLDSSLINNTENGTTQLYKAKYISTNVTKSLYYMFESFDQETAETSDKRHLLNGKYYDLEEKYQQTVYNNSTNWSAKALEGVTNVGSKNDGTNFYFYYDRITYNIVLYNMNSVYAEKQLKYGQSLEELMNIKLSSEDFSLETPGTKDWEFEGWYQDSNFMIPMEWINEDGSYKVLEESFVLYAKWLAPTYTITFDINGGNWNDSDSKYNKIDDNTYTLIVDEGDSIEKPQEPIKTGYIAQGWYYTAGTKNFEYLFSESQKIYSDKKLTIEYEASTNIPYKVRYIEAQYIDGVLNEDVSTYDNIIDLHESKEVYNNVFGSIVTEEAIDITDSENYYIVNIDKQELTLNSENIDENVIYFLYSKNLPVEYTIYYVKYQEDTNGLPIEYSRGAIPANENILKTITNTANSNVVEQSCEEIVGWTISGKETQELSITMDSTLNTMYFYYVENDKGQYAVNFFFADENGEYNETADYTYTAEDTAGKTIYSSQYDNFVWNGGASSSDYVGKTLDINKGNSYLIVTTTEETSAMDIYFRNRSDLYYTVRYVDQEGNSLRGSKVVAEQTYLSYVTEKAAEIDGYQILEGESQEQTIQIGLETNEIIFTYEVRNNLSYTVKYVDSDTGEEIKEPDEYGNQVFKTEVTVAAPEVDGYNKLDTEKTITITTGTNEVVFRYSKRTDLTYRAEYYYDNVIDESKTENYDGQTLKTEITEYEDKPEIGYRFDRIEPNPLVIGTGDNVLKVHYVTDENQTKELSYTVEYYKEGTLADTEIVTDSVQLLQEDILTVQKDKINVSNKFEGYSFSNTDPETIPDEIAHNGVIKVYYTLRNDLSYTIKYVDKDTREEIKESETKDGQIYNSSVTESAPSIAGYTPVNAEKTITIKVSGNEIVFEYAKRTDLSYTIKYVDIETNAEIKTADVKGNQTFKSEVTESAPEIEGYKITNETETITIDVSGNEIVFYYEILKGLPYEVNYYEEGTENKIADTKKVLENTYGTKITENAIDIDGYYVVEPSTQEITIGLNENVINFYYVKRTDLSYKVEYYFDNVLDENKTESFDAQTFGAEITEYTDKVEYGYKLGNVENLPLTISTNEEANTIKVYYVTDPSQTKELKYTIEYYIDGEIAETIEDPKTVQVLQPDTMTVNKDKINTQDKYVGHYFIKTEPEVIPDEVTTGEVIKVYYEIRKDLSYTINCINAETGEELREQEIVENQTYNSTLTIKAPTIDGYVPVVEEQIITIGLEENELTFEYTDRTDLTYRVEYYYNDVLDESKTENFEGLRYKTEITEYTDKVEKGYMLDRVETIPMIIGTEDNVIKVYYVADPSQTKTLKYNVEYYKDDVLAKTEPLTQTVQYLEPDIITVDKEKINIVDKFDGYEFVNTDPETIPDTATSGDTLKVNYRIRTDLSYTVKYIDKETNEDLLPSVTKENQTFNTKITETAPEVYGYSPDQESKSITITTGTNEIIFIYEKITNLPYTVNYYEEGTEEKITESKVVEGQTFGSTVEETAIEVDGYNMVEPTTKTLTIDMKDNEINFYYTRRNDLTYRVEYYFNDVYREELTDTFENQTFKTKISTYTNKVEKGYMVGTIENLPLTISTNADQNIIRIHYVTDPSQKKDLTYTVEYYKDDVLADTETETTQVQYLEPETMDVKEENINTTDKYEGYNYSHTEPEVIPDTVTNGDVIKVIYTVRKDLSYTIKYIDAETGNELKEQDIKENQTYNSEVTEIAPNIDGYVPVVAEKTITIGLEANEIIFEYTNRTDLTYRVEYYFNDVLDESKTDVFEEQTFKTEITEYTDKVEKGYKLDRVETVPMVIGTGDNVIKVYYVTDETQRKDLTYKVQYYKDGVLADTYTEKVNVQYLEPETMSVNKDNINTTNKFDGYYFVNTEPEVIPDTVTNGDVIKVNYTIRTDLSYTIKYIDVETNEEIKVSDVKENQTYNTEITEIAPDIEGYKHVNESETITIKTSENIIIFNYEKIDGLVYTVNYFEEGTENPVAESKMVEGNVFGDKIQETAIDIDGYNKIEPSSQEITIGVKENIINFYYAKRTDLTYKVEYYFNDVYAEELTDVFENQTFQTEVTEYTNKVEKGYKVGNVENLPLTVSTNADANIIKVYYVTDPNQKKDLTYTVEYYKDGVLADTEKETVKVQYLEPETMDVNKENINTLDKYEGYYFQNTEPEVIPDTVTNGDVIKVNYEVRKDLSYTIKYVDIMTGEELKEQDIIEKQTYNSEITETAPEIPGYTPVKSEATITIGLEANEITFEYTNRTDLKYRVEYYYSEVLDDSKTEVFEDQTYKTEITEYTDKVEYGYKLDRVENLPLVVSADEEANVIKVYYIIDESQTKELIYSVEYYKDEVLTDTETEKQVVQVLQPDTLKVQTDNINTNDKYDGYRYSYTEPEVIPEEVTNGDVIKVYYEIRKDLSYTVKYVNAETGEELLQQETIENQTFNTEVTEIAPEVIGYKPDKNEKTIKITTGTNEIVFEYTIRTDLSYTIKYVDSETGEEIQEETVVENQTYKTEVTEIAPSIDGYINQDTQKTITIEVEGNEIIFNYTKRKDLSYTIKYIDSETLEELKESDLVENQVFKAEITENAPDFEGYTKENPTETIVITTGTNEIVFKYKKMNNLKYTVNYYEEGTEEKITESKVVEGNVYGSVVEETAIEVDGYNKVEPTVQEITIKAEDNIINFYYTRRNDLSYKVEYYFNDVLAEEKTDVFENQTFKTEITDYTNKVEKGYKVGTVENLPLTISTNEETNIIKVYYVTDPDQRKELKYAVEYYKDGNLADTEYETKDVQYLEPEIMTVNKDAINVTDKYVGYTYLNTEPEVIPEEVTNGDVIKVNYTVRTDLSYTIKYVDIITGEEIKEQDIIENQTYNSEVTEIAPSIDGYVPIESEKTITIDIEGNEFVFEYTNRTDLTYTVEYYYNDVIDEAKTDLFEEQTYKSIVEEYTDKVEKGYKFDRVENLPLTISTDEEANKIKVYYVTDPTQRKELKYTVEYYKDGVLADTEYETKDVQYLEPETMEVNVENINTTDKYKGYCLLNTEPEVLPEEVTNGDVIKVNYTVRTDLSYTIKYVDIITGEEIKPADVKTNQTYNSEVTETAPSIDGYAPIESEKSITIDVEGNEFVFEYTNRTDLTYTVEYYYNDVIDEAKTDLFEEQTYKSIVEEYTDKVEKGYKLDRTENLPLTISADEEANKIKVYYVTDPDQRKELKYTIEYYKDGVLADTEYEIKDVQYLEPETMEVNVENINTKDKYEGYTYLNTEPEVLPEEVTNGDVIKVNYIARTDLSYNVKYVDAETGNELRAEEIKENQTYNSNVTEVAPNIDGYVPVVAEKTITIGLEGNEIVFEYTRAEVKYTVEYYYDNVLNAEETEELSAKYQDKIDKYEDKVFDGYKFEKTENFPLTISNNPEENVIKVYYQLDESKQKELSYTVEYYKAEVEVSEDEQKVSQMVQATLPDILNVDKTQINVNDKYYGYKVAEIKLNDEVIAEIPDTVANGDVIQILYVVDESATKELMYTIEYYKDNEKIEIEEIKQNIQVLQPDTLTVDKTKINTQDKFEGYRFEKTEPEIIPDVVNNGDTIKVYYTKNVFEYSINYYYDGIKDEENVVTLNGKLGDVIEEYPSQEKDGYELDRVENLPLTITEDPSKNIINVYYKLKDSQIIVKYVDKYANEEILSNEVINGKIFENYDLNQNVKEIPEYTLIDEPENLAVTFEEETKTYIFYYAKNSEVIVKYVEKDDTEDNSDNKVLAEEKISGYEGYEYVTVAKTIENYTLVSSSDNVEGVMTRETIEVIYYYTQNTKVVVNHIDQATGETMDSVEYTGNVGDAYQTEAKNFENYVLVEKPENESGVMTKETIVVNYYYSHVSSGVIEKHIDIVSNDVLEDKLHEGLEGTPYTTEEKEFEGYDIVTNIRYYSKYVTENPEILKDNDVETVEELLEKLELNADDKYIPENFEGKMAINTIEVNYYYVRKAEVKVEYIDKAANKPIMVGEEDSTVIISGHEGDAYTTELKEFSGYEIEKDADGNAILPENKDGKMEITTDENGNISTQVLVRYYYEKTSNVIEKHIDITTGKVIKEVVNTGIVGKEYETNIAELEGFEIVTNQRYYEKLIKENPEFLEENEVTTLDELLQKLGLNFDDKYVPENATGKITEENIEVKYYYIRKIKVIVQYIDKETGETIQSRFVENGIIQQKDPTVIFEGYEGDNYEAKVKSFENYDLVESEYPTNEKGIMAPVIKEDGTAENTVYVTYYYIRKKANVRIEYMDVTTGEIITEEIYSNNQGEEYNVKPKEIEGYDLVEEKRPTNESGMMTEDGATVRYYYIKKTKVIVRYVDVKTNEAIENETVINGHEGDDYSTQEKAIEGYSINKISGKTSGKMTREDIIVTYYYDKKEETKNPQNPEQPSNSGQTGQSNQNGTQNQQNATSNNTNNNNNNTTPTVTIKPSEDNTNNKNETIKTGDVGPNRYIGIICIIILANIIQIMFAKRKTKVIK